MRPLRRVALAIEVLLGWARVRLSLRGSDLPAALERLRSAGRLPAVPAAPDQLARAVQRTLALLPADGRCLTQSLVLTTLLARRGVAGTLVIGVTGDETEPFGAHAWVELAGRPLLPPGSAGFGRLVEL